MIIKFYLNIMHILIIEINCDINFCEVVIIA